MTFLSDIATALVVVLMACGVNLTDMTQGNVQPDSPAEPVATEILTPENTPEPTQEPVVTEQPVAATAAPTENPTTAAGALVESFLTESDVSTDVQTLATQMYAGIISGVKYQAPDIVEDNADTHLSTRWVDYKAASTARDDSTKLTAFSRPGVVPQVKTIYVSGSNMIAIADCTITLKTAAQATQEVKLTFTLKYANTASGRSIISLDISGDADYDTLKAMLPADCDISAIDQSVDAAISALA